MRAGEKSMILLLQGGSYKIKGNDAIFLERVSLQYSKDGVFYIPIVEENNMEPVSFKLTSNNNNSFVFENPHHDFPKRIVYEIVSSDSLHAYIDGGAANASKEVITIIQESFNKVISH